MKLVFIRKLENMIINMEIPRNFFTRDSRLFSISTIVLQNVYKCCRFFFNFQQYLYFDFRSLRIQIIKEPKKEEKKTLFSMRFERDLVRT